MDKKYIPLFCFLGVVVLGACRISAEEHQDLATAQNTAITSIPSETPVVSTPDLSMPTLTAPPVATQKTVNYTPNSSPGLTFEECSQGRNLTLHGNWALCNPFADPITLINQSNEVRQFSYKNFYGPAVTNPCTRLQHITDDEKYLYFSLDDGCILPEPGFLPSISLLRMDLANGQVIETLPASYDFRSKTGIYYSLSISPTGRRLAYFLHKDPPLSLNILDLQTGKNHSYQLDENYLDGGSFTWSQDGTRLVVMLLSEENYDQFIAMVFLDLLEDNSLVTFVKDQSYEWIISSVEITSTGIKISPPGADPLFYEFKTKILSPIK